MKTKKSKEAIVRKLTLPDPEKTKIQKLTQLYFNSLSEIEQLISNESKGLDQREKGE